MAKARSAVLTVDLRRLQMVVFTVSKVHVVITVDFQLLQMMFLIIRDKKKTTTTRNGADAFSYGCNYADRP